MALKGHTTPPPSEAPLAKLHDVLAAAADSGGPALVDVVTQPLHEAKAPVSEWVA